MPLANASPEMLSIGAEHPSLPGHFPGNPIVPGVVIVTQVFETLKSELPGWEIAGIKKLKFLQPLLPGQVFRVEYGQIKDNRLRFTCSFTATGTPLVEGRLKLVQRGAD